MIRKDVTIAIAVFLWCVNALAQQTDKTQHTPIKVIVKENRHFTFDSIDKVEKWGIVVSDKGKQQTIMYKVIERIELADSPFADKIHNYIPTVLVTRADGLIILDFAEADIPLLEHRDPKIIDISYIPLALRLDPVETFEVGLAYSLWPIHLFKHQFTFSTGLPYSEDPSYHVMALNYGIGTQIYSSERFGFLYHIYFHFKVMERTHGFASTFLEMNTISVEPQVLFFPGKRASPSVSLRYYFDNFNIEDSKQRLVLIATLNIALGHTE